MEERLNTVVSVTLHQKDCHINKQLIISMHIIDDMSINV